MSIYFSLDIIAKAVMSKGIGNIIDIFKFKEISKGMVSVMKNLLMAITALCVACGECGVTGCTGLHIPHRANPKYSALLRECFCSIEVIK